MGEDDAIEHQSDGQKVRETGKDKGYKEEAITKYKGK